MIMPKLSIVVPVYNVEKYLDRCMTSILNQEFSDWEMILVDDGSTDRCPALCDSYAEKDPRIKVIHKKNGGLSSARNAGLRIASGEYVGFVDSDDTIRKDMYSRMIQAAEEYQTDFVMSDYMRVFSDSTSTLMTQKIEAGLDTKDRIKTEIYHSLIMGSNIDYGPVLEVWRSMYRRSFLSDNDLTFKDDVRWSEDNLFSAFAGYHAESFYYLKGEGLYNYHRNEGTITTSYKKGAWQVYSRMHEYLQDYFAEKKDYDFSQELKWHMIYYACVCASQTKALDKQEATQELGMILNSPQLVSAFRNIDLSGVNKKLRVQLFLMKHKAVPLVRYLINRR